MSAKFIDTHAHYNSRQFNKNRNELLNDLKNDVEYIINIGTHMETNTEILQLVCIYDYVWGMIGFYPTDVWQLEETLCPNDVSIFIFNAKDNWDAFQHQLKNQKIVGIGEIGLDYHWESVGPTYLKPGETGKKGERKVSGNEARKIQQKWFKNQLDLAQELELPVSIHSREAEEDTIKILSNYDTVKGVVHCFSYGMDAADFFIKKGLYLGIGGTSTYPANKELREVIKCVPLNRLLLETDAPYLSPQPVRREINNSANISYVIDNIADLKQVSRDEVIAITNDNAVRLFGFKRK